MRETLDRISALLYFDTPSAGLLSMRYKTESDGYVRVATSKVHRRVFTICLIIDILLEALDRLNLETLHKRIASIQIFV